MAPGPSLVSLSTKFSFAKTDAIFRVNGYWNFLNSFKCGNWPGAAGRVVSVMRKIRLKFRLKQRMAGVRRGYPIPHTTLAISLQRIPRILQWAMVKNILIVLIYHIYIINIYFRMAEMWMICLFWYFPCVLFPRALWRQWWHNMKRERPAPLPRSGCSGRSPPTLGPVSRSVYLPSFFWFRIEDKKV